MRKFRLFKEQEEENDPGKKWTREEIKMMELLIKKGLDYENPGEIKNLLVKFGYDTDEIKEFYYLFKNNVVDGEFDTNEIPNRERNWEDFEPKQIALALFLDVEPFEIEEMDYSHYGLNLYDTPEGEYSVGTDDEAEQAAYKAAKSGIDEGFVSPDFIRRYITMTDTDRRLYAQEEADYLVDEVYGDDDIIKNAGIEGEIEEIDDLEITNTDRISEIEDEISELEDQQSEIEDEESNEWIELEDMIDGLKAEIKTLENIDYDAKKEEIIDDARDTVRDELYDEIYDELSDPVEYFVESKGIYTLDELIKNGPVFVDEDELADDMVSQDGRGHFLAHYDGDEDEQDYDGVTYYIYKN